MLSQGPVSESCLSSSLGLSRQTLRSWHKALVLSSSLDWWNWAEIQLPGLCKIPGEDDFPALWCVGLSLQSTQPCSLFNSPHCFISFRSWPKVKDLSPSNFSEKRFQQIPGKQEESRENWKQVPRGTRTHTCSRVAHFPIPRNGNGPNSQQRRTKVWIVQRMGYYSVVQRSQPWSWPGWLQLV